MATQWHEERTLPALRALLALDFEHVLVSHGEPCTIAATLWRRLSANPGVYGAGTELIHGAAGHRSRPLAAKRIDQPTSLIGGGPMKGGSVAGRHAAQIRAMQ